MIEKEGLGKPPLTIPILREIIVRTFMPLLILLQPLHASLVREMLYLEV